MKRVRRRVVDAEGGPSSKLDRTAFKGCTLYGFSGVDRLKSMLKRGGVYPITFRFIILKYPVRLCPGGVGGRGGIRGKVGDGSAEGGVRDRGG